MISHPKPRAAERKLAEYRRKEQLKAWRVIVRSMIYQRAKGICEIQKLCKGNVMCEIHHVYGRGKNQHDWREQADVMLATCRKCHPQPIKHKPAGPKLAWVEEILEEVNQQHRGATAAAGGSEI